MKTLIVGGLLGIALVTGAAGCMSRMHGSMMAGMMGSQEHSPSDHMMSMGQKGMMAGMMDCCNEQCPMMKGSASKAQPS